MEEEKPRTYKPKVNRWYFWHKGIRTDIAWGSLFHELRIYIFPGGKEYFFHQLLKFEFELKYQTRLFGATAQFDPQYGAIEPEWETKKMAGIYLSFHALGISFSLFLTPIPVKQ